jgi:membrane dipeptidase
MYYADSQAFLGWPGEGVYLHPDLMLNAALVTTAPPWAKTMADVYHEHMKFAAQLDGVYDSEKLSLVFGLQHVPDDCDLGQLRSLGIKVISVAYHGLTRLGSGWVNAGMGLTDDGREFIRDCTSEGMVVDLSHSSHQTARDVLKQVRDEKLNVSVIASHGGCYTKYHHMRNLPDDVLRGIADLGGIVGIATLTFILDERNDGWTPFTEHLEHAIKICGSDSVCIGSDAPYVPFTWQEAQERHEKLAAKLDPFGMMGARHPEHCFEFRGPGRMDSIAHYLGNCRILAAEPLEKVIGLNFKRFFSL